MTPDGSRDDARARPASRSHDVGHDVGLGAVVWWAPLTLADIGLRQLLPPDESARIDRADRAADRARRLLGAAVLRTAVAHRTGADPLALRIDRTCADCGAQHGRPRIIGHDLYASVSHSGLLTVVALAPDPVGVDVQRDSDVVATTGGDVAEWVRAEATLKARLEPDDRGRIVMTALHPPVAGHTAALARGVAGPVDERDAAVLLPRP